MTHRTAGKPGGPSPLAALVTAFWQGFIGAVDDCEQMVASDRARWLRAGVDWLETGARWAAWAWLVLLAWHVAVTPLEVGQVEPADPLMAREALFFVFGIVLVGPIAVGLVFVAGLFVHRVLASAVARRLPRAFNPLAARAVVLGALAAAWHLRDMLHGEFWQLYHTIADVFAAARAFTPVL